MKVVLTTSQIEALVVDNYYVFNNTLIFLTDIKTIDTYSDVLTGVPEVIDCELVELVGKEVFKFGE